MFRFKKNMNANGGRVLESYVITDAQTISVGEAVKLASGKLSTAAAGASIAGIVVSFVKANGAPLTDNGAAGGYVDTYTAPASNTVKAIIDVSKDSIYSVELDAAVGTTTGSGLAGYMADLIATSDEVDESTSHATTQSQVVLLGSDPDASAPANSVLCRIMESQISGPLAA